MKITLARSYEDASGKAHKAGDDVDLPRSEAANLIHLGHARHSAPKPKPAPPATDRKDA
jgi:hypothetical protein